MEANALLFSSRYTAPENGLAAAQQVCCCATSLLMRNKFAAAQHVCCCATRVFAGMQANTGFCCSGICMVTTDVDYCWCHYQSVAASSAAASHEENAVPVSPGDCFTAAVLDRQQQTGVLLLLPVQLCASVLLVLFCRSAVCLLLLSPLLCLRCCVSAAAGVTTTSCCCCGSVLLPGRTNPS